MAQWGNPGLRGEKAEQHDHGIHAYKLTVVPRAQYLPQPSRFCRQDHSHLEVGVSLNVTER